MSKKNRQNRKREPKISQMDKQGWKSLGLVIFKVVLTCTIAAGIPYAGYLYYQHLVEQEHFLPRNISIKGNVRVDDQAILDASGLKIEGTNLFETDVHTLEAGIETLSWVKKAKVKVELPDTVFIDITEHQPLGIVNDGQLCIVDQEGKYIKHWTSEDPVMAPIVSLDQPINVSARQIVQAFDVVELIVKHGYTHEIQEIHYDNATGFTLYTDESEIRLGYDRFDERIERLLIVENILKKRQVVASYILLDADNSLDRIVVKPKISVRPSPAKSKDNSGNSENMPDSELSDITSDDEG